MAVPQKKYKYPHTAQVEKVRKVKRRISPRKLTKWLFLAFLVYLIFSFSHSFYQAHQLKKEIRVLQIKLVKLKEENKKLLEELEYIQTPEAIEKIAREKLGLIKPGEIVILRAKEAKQ